MATPHGRRVANGRCALALLAEIARLRRSSRRTSSRVGNFFEVTRFSVELGLLAVALTPVIISGGIDLSVGAMLGLAAVVFGAAQQRSRAAAAGAAALRRLLVGAAGGALNALLIARSAFRR